MLCHCDSITVCFSALLVFVLLPFLFLPILAVIVINSSLCVLQLAWAYLFLSGLSGAALTYYYDDEGNVKLLNILKYGLMLVGLGLVYNSTSMTEASATLCVLLIASIPATIIWDKR